MLEETDRLFSCEFCRVKSYLIEKDYFRYVLPNSAPENKDLVYFPYWRFKGMLFSSLYQGIEHKVIDVSHQAIAARPFPVSVGIRSQTLKLGFVSPETKGSFLKPSVSLESITNTFNQRFSKSLPKPIFHQETIGETASMIYSPFYVEDKLFDAVLNAPVSPVLADDFDINNFTRERPARGIEFIPTLCPNCGWDLQGEKNSIVLICRNCNSLWRPAKKSLKQVNFAHIPANGKKIIYLPFWRIKADISTINLKSYADLIKIANLPIAVRNAYHKTGFRFWGPGFKVRPNTFINLGRSMTISQPLENLKQDLPDAELHPVSIPVRESIESLKIILASFIKPQKTLLPRLPEIIITAKSYLLVYIPFQIGHHEFIHPGLNIAINKNQLAMAKNL